MYQINGESHIFDWAVDRPTDEFEAMLAWLPRLAEDPAGVSQAERQRPGVPVYTAMVPGTNAFVNYTVVEQYHR